MADMSNLNPAGKDDKGREVFYGSISDSQFAPGDMSYKRVTTPDVLGFFYADGTPVSPSNLINNAMALNLSQGNQNIGLGAGVSPGGAQYAKVVEKVQKNLGDAPTYGDSFYDPETKTVVVRDANGVSIYNEQGNLISGRGSVNPIGIASGSTGRKGQIDINGVGVYGTPEYDRLAGTGPKQNLAYEGSALQKQAFGTATTTTPTTTTPTTTTPTTSTVVPTGLDAKTTALIKSLQDQITALNKQVTSTTTANTLAVEQKALEERQRKENALTSLTARFSQYGLQSLVPKIRELVINGSTESTIAFELQETPEYKQRFKANTERLKKGLSVLDAGTYIGMEDSYRQALRAYGLKQFDTDDYVSQFIANDISANELSNRIVTAVQRVQNADPAITKQLRDFYNIGQNDLVAYVLDPNQQFQKIERQVQAAEIGVAAARQGLNAGVQVAEQLAAQGVTQAEAQKGYATIADILPDAKRLSDIYGTTLEGYDQAQAEQEVFNQLASAQRKRQKLTQREIAAFGGSSGTNKTSLTTPSVGQF